MTPRRLLNSSEVGKRLGGLSHRAVTQRLTREPPTIPLPDFVIEVEGVGLVHGWLPGRRDIARQPASPDDPSLLGDPASLPDGFLVGMRQWGHLAGWTYGYVLNQRSAAARRRAQGRSQPPDMPPVDERRGNSPRWRMGTYRAWEAARQGKSSSEGKQP
jgi:hypothetical protein